MRTNRKKNLYVGLLCFILLLGIGFAALAANLKIDGTVNVSRTSWDVHFENVSITEGSVTANPAPTSDNTTTTEMAYTINFTKPGDFYEFTVDMVNDGTIDAMVDVVSNKTYSSNGTTEITLPTYLKNTVTYEDGTPILRNQKLDHNTTEKIKVRVEFRQDIQASDLPSSGDTTVVFKFIGDYKQADENAVSTYDWRLPEGRTKDNLEVGDEICTRDQCFNFIKYDGQDNDIVMLAKYNLKVGYIYSSSGIKTGEYTSNDPGYGKQSSEARGWVAGASTYSGPVAFSATNYWYDGSSLKTEYGTSYPADVYDKQYKGAPGENDYSIAYYVEGYKTKLIGYGVTIKNARLLTYDEATDSSIGCDASNWSCPTNGFITNTTFWLGSALSKYGVWLVSSDGAFNGITYYNGSRFGVRPVVVISKSDI